jgi:5,10-methylenetetrahydromethanopterin reductase
MKIDIVLDPSASADEISDLGRLAESLGIRAVWTANILSSRDPFMAFSVLARASEQIRMGPMAISPFELHPVKMANALLTLNEFSHGRANILVGGGGGASIAMGLKPNRRTMYPRMVRGVQECVEFLKGITPDRALNYQGEVFRVDGYQPAWARDEAPLIYVGATMPQMLRMAAGIADGTVMADVPLARIDERVALIRGALDEHGRNPDEFRISNLFAWHIKKDRAQAIDEARRKLFVRGMLMRWLLSPYLSDADCDLVEAHFDVFARAYMNNSPEFEGVPDRIVDTIVEALTFAGDHSRIEAVIEDLRAFRKAGLTEVTLRLYDDPAESIRLIGEHVVPALST